MTEIQKRQGKRVLSILGINPFKLLYCIFLVSSLLLFLPPPNAHPAQVNLAWNASTDPTTAGYKIYYGTSSGSYQSVVDAGNTTTCSIPNLLNGVTYYFAATDYNTSGTESGYSNEVSYNTSSTSSSSCSYSISPSSQSVSSSGGPGTVNVTTSSGCSWTAVSNVPWMTITSNSSGSGNGAVNYSVSANSTSSSQTGTVTIAGKTFTVTQSGSSPSSGSSGNWTFCADENNFCSFTGTQNVRYGANGTYVYKSLTNGTMCSNSVFGDPIYDVVKQCYIQGSGTSTGSPSNGGG